MQKANSLLTHNVIGRITHGLIGLELFLKEKKSNNYLKDFLTLKEEEIKASLLSASAKMGLILVSDITLSEEQNIFVQTVLRAQEAVKKIDVCARIDHYEELESLILDLGSKLDVIYRHLTH